VLQVSGLPVYGVGNPTIDGVRHVLRRVNDGGRRPVLWQNMREEPVVYINGKPFVLREVERPFKNMLEYTVSAEGAVTGPRKNVIENLHWASL
jgi:hypothetical protein